MKISDLNHFNYIATQPLLGGLDEIQQLFLCYATGCHVALSGPPGVGKTTLVEEFAEKVQQPMISRVMGPKVNESMLISYPELVSENGVSVTVTRPGLLAKALQEEAIYFADEMDRLTEDNQKLHNAAFDNRRSLTLRDGTRVKGRENFFGIIAYNPTEGLKNDLESALADRFVHINFSFFKPEIESMVTLKQAGISVEAPIKGKRKWKAVYFFNVENKKKQIGFYDVLQKNGQLQLFDPFRRKTVDLKKSGLGQYKNNLFVYQAIEPVAPAGKYISAMSYSIEELAIKLAELCSDIRQLALNGSHGMDKAMLAKFQKEGQDVEFNNIRLHLPSSRIQQFALKQYQYLTRHLHYPAGMAQAYATLLVINQAGYGKFGTRRIGQNTNRELLMTLAGAKRLLPLQKQRSLGEPTALRKKRAWL